MFFPFDPYLLRRSARFLNLQVRWSVSMRVGAKQGFADLWSIIERL